MIRKIYLFLLLLIGIQMGSLAQDTEYVLKAAFLEKFARFSDWPQSDSSDFFIITVIGNDSFAKTLEKTYSDIHIKNKPVAIKHIQSIYEIDNCHMLFIAANDKDRLSYILHDVSNKPILTISETQGFAQKGVIINFYETTQGTLHFEINRESLAQSGIKMDVMLLDFAKIIKN